MPRSSLFLVMLVTLLGSFANGHAFSTCKSEDLLGVSSLSLTPDPPIAGKTVDVQVTGTSKIDLAEGKLHVEMKVMGIKVYSEIRDMCTVVSCPLVRGEEFKGVLKQDIPAETPNKAGATIRISLVSADGSSVSCLETYVQVSREAVLMGEEQGHPLKYLFEHWRAQFPKAFLHSKDTFFANVDKVLRHNSDKSKTFEMALNEFAGMTEEQFVSARMGVREPKMDVERNGPMKPRVTLLRPNPSQADPPSSLDWTDKGVVSPVKNQGSCGSCWAFSAVGALESAYAIKTGNLVQFSEQELVSCDDTDYGCQGGLMDSAFDWIERSSAGLCKEDDYPYTSGVTTARGECAKAACAPVEGSVPTGYVDVPPNESALLAALTQHGPIAVAIEADQSAFQFYHKGVLTGACGTHLNHGVLLVGFGVDAPSGVAYWKVKNSWGAGWGEEGFIRMQRGKRWPMGGECGIAQKASYPVL